MPQEKSKAGKIYVVATPIGNLGDFSPRAREVLASVDLIAAEDTRVTKRLLSATGVVYQKIESFHEHSTQNKILNILETVMGGASVAIVTDAGTPCVSDPGFELIEKAHREGIEVIPIPGPSSVVAALSASGFRADSFVFHGFAPRKKNELRSFLEHFAGFQGTHVFFESPHRILQTLAQIHEVYPNEEMAFARELTKLYEEILKGKPEDLLGALKSKPAIKGEFVVMINLENVEKATSEKPSWSEDDLMAFLIGKKQLNPEFSKKDLSAWIEKAFQVPKKRAYSLSIQMPD